MGKNATLAKSLLLKKIKYTKLSINESNLSNHPNSVYRPSNLYIVNQIFFHVKSIEIEGFQKKHQTSRAKQILIIILLYDMNCNIKVHLTICLCRVLCFIIFTLYISYIPTKHDNLKSSF